MSGKSVFHPNEVKGFTSGGVPKDVTVSADGHLEVVTRDNASALGEKIVAENRPRVQIDAIFGLRSTDIVTFTAGTGAVVAEDSLFKVTTGTTSASFASVQSRRSVRYRPGQGLAFRFGGRFDQGVANFRSYLGAFTSVDGVFFGYNGTQFGVLRRIAGSLETQELTISAAASGAENIDIVLDGTTYSTSVTAGTARQNASEIVSNGTWTGWNVQAIDNTVVFQRQTPLTNTGAYSFTNTTGGGTCAGSLSQLQAGSPNDDDTDFIPQTSWNVDKMDGTGPSGLTLDPSKLNDYQIVLPWSGAGTITFMIYYAEEGHFVPVHELYYSNRYTIPSLKQPSLQLGAAVISEGSTTDLGVYATAMSGFVQGSLSNFRQPFSADNIINVATTEIHILSVRSGIEFNNLVNKEELIMRQITSSIDSTGNKTGRIRLYVNATLTGQPEWDYVDESVSAAQYCITGVTGFSGGTKVLTLPMTANTASIEDISELDIRLERGETLTITAELASSSADTGCSITWQED